MGAIIFAYLFCVKSVSQETASICRSLSYNKSSTDIVPIKERSDSPGPLSSVRDLQNVLCNVKYFWSYVRIVLGRMIPNVIGWSSLFYCSIKFGLPFDWDEKETSCEVWPRSDGGVLMEYQVSYYLLLM